MRSSVAEAEKLTAGHLPF